MPADQDNSSTASGEPSISSSTNQTSPLQPTKKKRNQPGMPDPDAEVIALSPKTLMATNRFVCEICDKGFQRDQNLQLHRRGHNLPWKLKQRSSQEIRKRVYVCPEPLCVHHHPSRALGDLTGIKKHFCRKHGEKKYKCDKCAKNYAVQSDFKAHSKICGAREYKCDCGTIFSRRDSFITHRAFCDALSVENAKGPQTLRVASSTPPPPPPPPPPEESVPSETAVIPSILPTKSPELLENPNSPQVPDDTPSQVVAGLTGSCSSSGSSSSNGSTSSNVFASLFASSTVSGSSQPQKIGIQPGAQPEDADQAPLSSSEPISLCLSTNHRSSNFGAAGQEHRQYALAAQPALSATALLQKAAQMGPTTSNASLLMGFGLGPPEWNVPERASVAVGLGLGLTHDGGSSLKELMMGTPSVFGPKHTTLDLLGLGMAAGGGPASGFSALMSSFGRGTSASFGGGEFTKEEEVVKEL